MSTRSPLLVAAALLITFGLSPAAWAQEEEDEDDLLAPLTPLEPKEKRPKGRVKKKPTTPAREELPAASGPSQLAVRLPDALAGTVKNAKLYVDDKEIGVLPVDPVEVTPGEHRVLVKRLGYAPFSATVKVKESGVTELLATLEATAGVVSVSSDVVGAEVFVDGKSYGPVPVNDLVLAPGDHLVRLRREGYEEQTSSLSVKAGRDYTVRMSLTPAAVAAAPRTDRPERDRRLEMPPPPATNPVTVGGAGTDRDLRSDDSPWYGQWYVWTGGAVLAAGAAAGTVYLATRPPAERFDGCINGTGRPGCPSAITFPLFGMPPAKF
jgi:hypothetical protein